MWVGSTNRDRKKLRRDPVEFKTLVVWNMNSKIVSRTFIALLAMKLCGRASKERKNHAKIHAGDLKMRDCPAVTWLFIGSFNIYIGIILSYV